MTHAQFNEAKILIAEFMGKRFYAYDGNISFDHKYKTFDACQEFIVKNKLDSFTPQLGWKIGLGKYDSSWNWLMPVVQKIEKMGYIVTIEVGNCKIKSGRKTIASCSHRYNLTIGKMNSVFTAVAEFIKWNNKQKSK